MGQFQVVVVFFFFLPQGWDIDLDLCHAEFALEMNEIILSFLRFHPWTAFQTILWMMRATPFLLRDSCPK